MNLEFKKLLNKMFWIHLLKTVKRNTAQLVCMAEWLTSGKTEIY